MSRVALIAIAALLAGCAPPASSPEAPSQKATEEKPRADCCAIAPRAKCRGELAQAGVTLEEADLLLGPPEAICPSGNISEQRLRKIASLQGPLCKAALGYDVLATLNAGKCRSPTN